VSASTVALPSNARTSNSNALVDSPTVFDFLCERFPAVPPQEWSVRFADSLVLNAQGEPINVATPYAPNTLIHYYRRIPQEPELPFKAQVLFRDAHLVVADKPHFMPVTPAGRYVRSSLLVQLKEELGIATLSPLHRIDRETAGLVVLSVNPQERDAYQALFRERLVHKTYQAVALYRDDLVFPLTRQSRIEEDAQFFLSREAEGAPNSETHIEILKCLDTGLNPSVHPSDDSTEGSTRRSPQSHYKPKALYQLSPITGKRHQLRIHMCALGIPIEGDQFYPEVLRGPDEREDFSQPLQLLAQKIAFTDPISGEKREFISKQKLVWMS
jgi:tRNA pseudouridine32 synthase/23S rRNA pseudouridine746 synthase